MKKHLLTLSLVSILSAVGLTSFVKAKQNNGKDVIVTIINKNYTADELLSDYGNTTAFCRIKLQCYLQCFN